MRDYNEKYLLIKEQFPNKAGELRRILEAQKRLIKRMGLQKGNTGDLMILCAEGYDVSVDLLEWFKNVLNGICEDSEALREGSRVRNSLAWQNSIVEAYLDRYDKDIERIQQKLKNHAANAS